MCLCLLLSSLSNLQLVVSSHAWTFFGRCAFFSLNSKCAGRRRARKEQGGVMKGREDAVPSTPHTAPHTLSISHQKKGGKMKRRAARESAASLRAAISLSQSSNLRLTLLHFPQPRNGLVKLQVKRPWPWPEILRATRRTVRGSRRGLTLRRERRQGPSSRPAATGGI